MAFASATAFLASVMPIRAVCGEGQRKGKGMMRRIMTKLVRKNMENNGNVVKEMDEWYYRVIGF